MKCGFDIPIYDCRVYLVISNKPYEERAKFNDLFGVCDGNDWKGLCSYNERGYFGLFFKQDEFNTKTLAHEIFHLTHRILEYNNIEWNKDHHETGARLCGYLTNLVHRRLVKFAKL